MRTEKKMREIEASKWGKGKMSRYYNYCLRHRTCEACNKGR